MKTNDIEKYLAHLGQELASQGVETPIRVLNKRFVDRYILPFTQEHNLSETEKTLDVLFPPQKPKK